MDLTQKHCVPCEGGTPPLSPAEVVKYHARIPGWKVLDNRKIIKGFTFKDFKEAMVFVNKVADIAEAESHHPDLHISYDKVRVELWTHAVAGLSENDFILAAKIDALLR
jgi:4a-hydroxytetrahydrobiopterin dehydratase